MRASHAAVLRALEAGPLDTGVLAQRTQLSPSKVGRTLDALERDERIERLTVAGVRVARLAPRRTGQGGRAA